MRVAAAHVRHGCSECIVERASLSHARTVSNGLGCDGEVVLYVAFDRCLLALECINLGALSSTVQLALLLVQPLALLLVLLQPPGI